MPWEETNAAKNLHILACKLDLCMYVFFHKCLASMLSAGLQQVHVKWTENSG